MNMHEQGQNLWNTAYTRGGNICFYPHEEVIRFVNKYVRKRKSIDEFDNVLLIASEEWENFTSLDLGCGIGRHVNFLDEFGLNPYGIDLSDTAIAMGKQWLSSMKKADLAERLIVGSAADLPFMDNQFDLCVSCGVLDSMPRDISIKGMAEVHRVLKSGALMYLDLIMDPHRGDMDVIVDSGYEKDTIQSYFTVESIEDFVRTYFKIIEFKIINWTDEKDKEINRRAHLIIQNK